MNRRVVISGIGTALAVGAAAGLEARPAEWKMLFRAGKPATDAARAFARKWLADLEGKGVK